MGQKRQIKTGFSETDVKQLLLYFNRGGNANNLLFNYKSIEGKII